MGERMKRGIYLLPNVLTTFGLFSGFFSIILAINEKFILASIAIFFAMLWDGLDGRVARLTNTQSEFGAQYDSMADLLSFVIAPALLVYLWHLSHLGKVGWISAFIFVVAGALRLARFNTQIGIEDKRYFQGLPSPSAAAILAGIVWAFENMGIDRTESISSLIVIFLVVFAGLLMVSNIRYYSFKEFNLKGRSNFRLAIIAAFTVAVVMIWPSTILFSFFFVYALSGVIITIIDVNKKRSEKKKISKT